MQDVLLHKAAQEQSSHMLQNRVAFLPGIPQELLMGAQMNYPIPQIMQLPSTVSSTNANAVKEYQSSNVLHLRQARQA